MAVCGKDGKNHIREDLMDTLKNLQVDYLDAYVIHWPMRSPSTGNAATLVGHGSYPAHFSKGTMFPLNDDMTYCNDMEGHFVETYNYMETLIDEGLVKSIGVSNFNLAQLKEVVGCVKKHKVSVLQNECHPYLQQKDIIDYCKIKDIQFQAYMPLGSWDRPMAKEGESSIRTFCIFLLCFYSNRLNIRITSLPL